MGSPDEVSRRVRQGYRLTIYPAVVKKKKEYIRIKSHGFATSGYISAGSVNGRKEIGVDGKPRYVTSTFEYRNTRQRYIVKK